MVGWCTSCWCTRWLSIHSDFLHSETNTLKPLRKYDTLRKRSWLRFPCCVGESRIVECTAEMKRFSSQYIMDFLQPDTNKLHPRSYKIHHQSVPGGNFHVEQLVMIFQDRCCSVLLCLNRGTQDFVYACVLQQL